MPIPGVKPPKIGFTRSLRARLLLAVGFAGVISPLSCPPTPGQVAQYRKQITGLTAADLTPESGAVSFYEARQKVEVPYLETRNPNAELDPVPETWAI